MTQFKLKENRNLFSHILSTVRSLRLVLTLRCPDTHIPMRSELPLSMLALFRWANVISSEGGQSSSVWQGQWCRTPAQWVQHRETVFLQESTRAVHGMCWPLRPGAQSTRGTWPCTATGVGELLLREAALSQEVTGSNAGQRKTAAVPADSQWIRYPVNKHVSN